MQVVLKKSEAKEPFTFAFIDGSGASILRSENYKEKKSASNGIESVRKNADNDARYAMAESKNGKFFFNLKAANGQVIGTSKLFGSDADRAKAVADLKASAAAAKLDDQTA